MTMKNEKQSPDHASWCTEHLARLKASGKSKADYARENGIPVWKVYQQLKEPLPTTSAQAFVRVQPEPAAMAPVPPPIATAAPTRVRLVVENTLAIETETSADPMWLARLLTGLREGRR